MISGSSPPLLWIVLSESGILTVGDACRHWKAIPPASIHLYFPTIPSCLLQFRWIKQSKYGIVVVGNAFRLWRVMVNPYYQSNFTTSLRCLSPAHLMDVLKFSDITKKQCLHTFQCHTGLMNASSFSHDSQQTMSAPSDHTITIWVFYSGNCLHTLDTDNGPLSLSKSPAQPSLMILANWPMPHEMSSRSGIRIPDSVWINWETLRTSTSHSVSLFFTIPSYSPTVQAMMWGSWISIPGNDYIHWKAIVTTFMPLHCLMIQSFSSLLHMTTLSGSGTSPAAAVNAYRLSKAIWLPSDLTRPTHVLWPVKEPLSYHFLSRGHRYRCFKVMT
jgi:WD40 repeat protein